MPSLAYLRAAKMPGKEPVLLAQIDNTGEQSAEYGTKLDWEGSATLTNIDTAEVDGSAIHELFNLSFTEVGAANTPWKYTDGDGINVNVAALVLTPVSDTYLNRLNAAITWPAGLGTSILTRSLVRDAIENPTTEHITPEVLVTSTTAGYGSTTASLISAPTVVGGTTRYIIIQGYDTGSGRWFNLTQPRVIGDYHLAVDCVKPTAQLVTSTIDMGSVPTVDVVLSIDDVKPAGTSIAYSAMGGNVDPPVNNIGVVADGDTMPAYKYYDITADFATTNGARAQVSRFSLQTTEKIIYSTRKNAPLIGALPYLPEDAFNEQSSSIDIDKPSTVGQTTLKLLWRKLTGEIVATGHLKGKAVSLMHGFDGLPSGDFEPLFTGSWYDYTADHEEMIFDVEIQDVLKKFMKIKLPLETFDSSGNKTTSPLEWTTPTNLMQVSLDIIDELGIPDRFIDRPAIEALRDGDFNTPDYDVTRSITKPTEAWKLLYELSVIGGFFWVPMPDGTLLPVPFDPNTTPAVVLDARKVSVGRLKGGQKDIFTRQLIYYDVAAGVTDPGENEEDYDKGLRQISTTAESNWGEKSEKRFFEKWAASVYLVDQLAHRREGWYSDPKHSFGIEDVPIHHIGANPGQIVQINNLRIPTAAADWGNLSMVCCLMLSKKVNPLDGNISYGVRQIFVPNIFYPTSVAFTAGTGTGTIADMQNADGTYYTVNEVTATPGFEVDFTFANVDQDVQQLTFKGRYEGNVGHAVEIQIYDNDATAWVDVRVDIKDLPHSTTDYYRVFDLPHPIGRYRDGSDNVKVKIIHTTAGSNAHKLYIDQLRLRT